MNAAIIESTQMATGDAQLNAADFDVGHLFGFDDGLPHIFFDCGCVSDFTFANSTGASLAQTNDVQGAVLAEFTHNGADFGSADFESDDNRGGVKHASF